MTPRICQNFFFSIFHICPRVPSTSPNIQQTYIPELVILVNTDNVLDFISRIDSFSSMGPDELQPHLSKTCRFELAEASKLIFCSSFFTNGTLPTDWKKRMLFLFSKRAHVMILRYEDQYLLHLFVERA